MLMEEGNNNFEFIMDATNQQDHLPNCRRDGQMIPRRRRCKSWNLHSQIPVDTSAANTDNLVQGEALVCFARDGTSFTGNLVTKRLGSVFKVHGVLIDNPSLEAVEVVTEAAIKRLNSLGADTEYSSSPSSEEVDGGHRNSCSNSFIQSTPTGSTASDGLDSDDINDAIASLDIDDLEEEDDLAQMIEDTGERVINYYVVTVVDMETGLRHSISNVKVVRHRKCRVRKSRHDECRIVTNHSNQLRFVSSQRLFGATADLEVNKQLGPQHVEQKYIMFKGEMEFSYRDPICYPVSSVNETQWCL